MCCYQRETIWYSKSAIMDFIIITLTILTRVLWIIHVYKLLKQKNIFHKQGNWGSRKIHILQHQIGWPSYTTFKYTVVNNFIRNIRTTVKNIEQSVYIYDTPK